MTRKEFITELHQLYLKDINYWMKEQFEKKGLYAEVKQDKENSLKKAIIKNDGMDYDYLEWACEGLEDGLSLESQLQCLEDNDGPLSSRWDYNTDEEDEEIFNRYKKYYDTIPMEEHNKQVRHKLVMQEVEQLKDKTSEEIDKALSIYVADFAEDVKHEINALRQTA